MPNKTKNENWNDASNGHAGRINAILHAATASAVSGSYRLPLHPARLRSVAMISARTVPAAAPVKPV